MLIALAEMPGVKKAPVVMKCFKARGTASCGMLIPPSIRCSAKGKAQKHKSCRAILHGSARGKAMAGRLCAAHAATHASKCKINAAVPSSAVKPLAEWTRIMRKRCVCSVRRARDDFAKARSGEQRSRLAR